MSVFLLCYFTIITMDHYNIQLILISNIKNKATSRMRIKFGFGCPLDLECRILACKTCFFNSSGFYTNLVPRVLILAPRGGKRGTRMKTLETRLLLYMQTIHRNDFFRIFFTRNFGIQQLQFIIYLFPSLNNTSDLVTFYKDSYSIAVQYNNCHSDSSRIFTIIFTKITYWLRIVQVTNGTEHKLLHLSGHTFLKFGRISIMLYFLLQLTCM